MKTTKRRGHQQREEDDALFGEPHSSHLDNEDEESIDEDELTEIDVLDLSGDAIHEVLPYLEQCEKEGRTLADVISEFWEAVSE